jgi:hypothetical protein
MPKGWRMTGEVGSGIAQRWRRRRRGIDDRDESRKDPPVLLRTRHFALLRVSGAPGDHHHDDSGLCKTLPETALLMARRRSDLIDGLMTASDMFEMFEIAL